MMKFWSKPKPKNPTKKYNNNDKGKEWLLQNRGPTTFGQSIRIGHPQSVTMSKTGVVRKVEFNVPSVEERAARLYANQGRFQQTRFIQDGSRTRPVPVIESRGHIPPIAAGTNPKRRADHREEKNATFYYRGNRDQPCYHSKAKGRARRQIMLRPKTKKQERQSVKWPSYQVPILREHSQRVYRERGPNVQTSATKNVGIVQKKVRTMSLF